MQKFTYAGEEFTAQLVQDSGHAKALSLFGRGAVWRFRIPSPLCAEAQRAYRRRDADRLLKVCEAVIDQAAATGDDLYNVEAAHA